METNNCAAPAEGSLTSATPTLVVGAVPSRYPTMRTRKRRQKGTRLPPFVAMPWELLNSRAFIELNNAARVALIYFIGKPHMIYNSPDYYDMVFGFSYREAKRLGFPSGTFFKVINELVRHGFLEPERKGGCYGDLKASNCFRLSRRWQRYGCPDFQNSDWAGFIHKPRKTEAPHV